MWATSMIVRAFIDNREFQAQALTQALAFLMRHQNEDGGWGYSPGIISDNESTAHTLLALNDARKIPLDPETGVRIDGSLRSGVAFLKRNQEAMGLWTTWQSAGDAVVPEVLGHILEAVTACGQEGEISLKRAVQWIGEHQDLDGGWRGGLCRNFPYVQSALLRGLPAGSQPAIKGRAALLSAANSDGGWGIIPGTSSCASSTGIAVSELCRVDPDRYRGVIRQAVSFLLDRQRANGSWESKPEMYGPRPLLFFLQPISHAFTASGLVSARSCGIHP
jgi:squalene-hopene/tetraprenyl-beta-curcumene cyclase